jgi:hypothetical protein
MSINDTLKAYQRIRPFHKLPQMEVAALNIEVTDELTPALAWEKVQAWQPLEGWLQFQSKTVAFMGGALPEPKKDCGYLLDGEVFEFDGKSSLSVRTLSPGIIRLTIATPLKAGTGKEELLADDVRQLATGKTGHEYLCYRRYWRHDEQLGFLPFYAAFQGFAKPVKSDAP